MQFLLAALLAAASPARPLEAPSAVPWDGPPIEAPVQTFKGDPLRVKQVVLENGLTVLLSENHERPEVFGAVVVRTGGKNDPADNTGMAHYLEHMLFKGTTHLGTTDWTAERPLQERLEGLYERLGKADKDERKRIGKQIGETVKKTYAYAVPNELDQLLEQIGGTGVNAFTTWDETVYHNTFPASQLDAWLKIYAHRFVDPVFRLFPTELEAVYEEKNIAIDTTGYELFRQMMKGIFPEHGYSQDILGEVEHLKRPSLLAMKSYFKRYYVPRNMALVLSGDFATNEALLAIETHFGGWKAGPDPKAPPYKVDPFEPNQRLSVRLSPVRVGAIAFRTVPERHPDYAALMVARRLLSNEQRSGFIDRVSDDGKVLIAFYVPADFADHNIDGVAYVPRIITQTFRRAEGIMLEQFARVRDGDFDDATLEALKEGLLAEEEALFEDNEDRALAMGHAFVARGGWQGHVDYLHRLRAVTKADVQRVAAELFAERRLVLRSRMGFPKKKRLKKPATPPVKPRRGAHSKMYREVRGLESPPPKIAFVEIDQQVATQQIRPGVTLAANRNPFNELYHLELVFGVGIDAIRELDMLEGYLPRIGSEDHPGKKFQERLFALSTTLEVEAELDRFIVRLHGPQRHMDAALSLLAELMRDPKHETKALRQLRREIWAYRRFERKDPGNVADALLEHVLYRDNSEYRREYGPNAARFVGRKRLFDAWEHTQRYAVDVRYVGNLRPKEVAGSVRRRLTFADTPKPAVSHVVYERKLPSETTVFFVPRRDAVQTHLWFAVQGRNVGREAVARSDAFSEYLGGSMAGLVFQEIREFRALAYSAGARYARDETFDQRGYLRGYVGCQADKTFEALDVMLGLITDMPRQPERLDLVRSALLRSQETASPSFRELQDQIDEWHWRGYSGDPRRWLIPAYTNLEFEDIAAFYKAHVAKRPVAIMVVGDPRKVKPRKLRKYGRVVKVREGSLYSL